MPIFAVKPAYLRTSNNAEPKMTGIPSDGLITMNGKTEFTFCWAEYLGELSSGKYWIIFGIKDIYDPESIHPFLRDYTEHQVYSFEFEIP